MENEQDKLNFFSKQIKVDTSQYKSPSQIFLTLLKWFVPAGIVTALLTGLGIASMCFMFCYTSPIENLFIWLGIGSIVISLIFTPIISLKRIAQADSKNKLIVQTIWLTFVGYLIIFGITGAWFFVSNNYNSEQYGWKLSMNEQAVNWIQATFARINDKKRDVVMDTKFNDSSFHFVPGSSQLFLINSNYIVLNLTGILSGLNKLNGSDFSFGNQLIISEVTVGDKVVPGDISKRLEGIRTTNDERLYTGDINLGSDSQEITIPFSLPKEYATILKNDPKIKFKVKLVLISESPNTFDNVKFSSIWSQEVEITPKYMGQYLRDINYKLPDDAIKYTSIDSSGNFFTEPSNYVNFTVTTNPRQSLCCDTPELKVFSIYNQKPSLEEYVNTLPWKDEIISKKFSPVSSFQLGILEAHPTVASPYKEFIYSRYGDYIIYQLTGKNSGLDDLYNQYLESYKKLVQFK